MLVVTQYATADRPYVGTVTSHAQRVATTNRVASAQSSVAELVQDSVFVAERTLLLRVGVHVERDALARSLTVRSKKSDISPLWPA